MFLPNNRGMMRWPTGYDINGNTIYSAPVMTPCAVVKLLTTSEKTNVRTDSSGSGSSAEETIEKSKILFPANVAPEQNCLFEIAGIVLRITGSHRRYSVLGALDHFECDLMRHGEI